MKRTFLLILFLNTCIFLHAQDVNPVYFKNMGFYPRYSPEKLKDFPWQECRYGDYYHILLQFNKIPDAKSINAMQESGIYLDNFLHKNSYLARITNPLNVASPIFQEFSCSAIDKIVAEAKTDTRLKQIQENAWIHVSLYCFPSPDFQQYHKTLKNKNIEVSALYPRFRSIHVFVRKKQIPDLAALPFVIWIEAETPAIASLNYFGKGNHRSNVLDAEFSGKNAWFGKGIRAGIWDSGPVGSHLDFDFRLHIKQGDSSLSNHATHVAGTLAGAGFLYEPARGMATKTHLYSWDFFGNIPYEMDSARLYDSIHLTQNSYAYSSDEDSCHWRGIYDNISNSMDQLSILHPELLHVFAAGNFQKQCSHNGFRTVSSGFQAAKNNLTVGALNKRDAMSNFSSWGPVLDGRLKPEICATGVDVLSTLPDNTYSGNNYSGTSMACPGVSGTVAQLLEAWHATSGTYPPIHSIKAILCNSARDMGHKGPDYKYGFGRIDAQKAYACMEEKRFRISRIAHEDSNTIPLIIAANTEYLKIMICWNDPPATAAAAYALINDLDIRLKDPNDQSIYPLVPDPLNPENPAQYGTDTLNNIEQILLENPAPGNYNIEIIGSRVTNGFQEYTLCWETAKPGVNITYPYGGESFEPGTTETLLWSGSPKTNSSGTFTLEISYDGGSKWTVLASAIPPKTQYYDWLVPDTAASLCKIRISHSSGLQDMSSSVFSIMKKPDTLSYVGCNQQVTLRWNLVKNSAGYEIYGIDTGAWKFIDFAPDTFFTLKNLNNQDSFWYSVRAVSYNGAKSKHSLPINVKADPAKFSPSILVQAQMDVACKDSQAMAFIRIKGTEPIQMQWQYSNMQGLHWFDIPYANDTLLIFTKIPAEMHGNLLRFVCSNMCADIVISDSLTVQVDSGYSLKYTAAYKNYCPGDTALFQAQITGGIDNFLQWQERNYADTNWKDMAGENRDSLLITDVQRQDHGREFRLLIRNNCLGDSFTSASGLFVYDTPSVRLEAHKDTLCPGDSLHLAAHAWGGDSSIYSYFWNNPAVQGDIYSMLPEKSAWHTVLISDACNSKARDSVFVFLRKIVSEWTYRNDSLHVEFQPLDTMLLTYLWYFGDGDSSVKQKPHHTYQNASSYYVCLQVSDSFCQEQSCDSILLYSLGTMFNKGEKVLVYPNPSKNSIFIELPSLNKDIIVRIFNMQGTQVFQKSYPPLQRRIMLDIGHWESSVYILEIRTEDKLYSKKFRIIH
jgi:subtilisin family serine protease